MLQLIFDNHLLHLLLVDLTLQLFTGVPKSLGRAALDSKCACPVTCPMYLLVASTHRAWSYVIHYQGDDACRLGLTQADDTSNRLEEL